MVTLVARMLGGDLHVMAELVSFGRRVEIVEAIPAGRRRVRSSIRGLRAIAQAFVEQLDVEELVIAWRAANDWPSDAR